MENCEINNKKNLCKMNIEIPFDSTDKPQIVLDVLKVDIPQQRDPVFENSTKPQFDIQDKTLHVSYTADSVRELRSAASSFYDQVLLITNIIKEFSD